MRLLILSVALLLASTVAEAQNAFPAAELSFDGYFASRGGDQDTIYSLLGAGFFRTPRSGQVDSLIVAWTNEHPDASVVPVSTMGPMMQDGSGTMIYVWLVDGPENLNLHLIRQGAFPGGVLQDHVATFQQMDADVMPPEEAPTVRRFVPDAEYEAFIELVIVSEAAASAEGLGVWAEGLE